MRGQRWGSAFLAGSAVQARAPSWSLRAPTKPQGSRERRGKASFPWIFNAAVRQHRKFQDSVLTPQVPRSRNRALLCACVRRGPCWVVFQRGGCDLSIFACRTIILMVSIFNPSAGQKCTRECSGSGAAPARPGPAARRGPGPTFGQVKRGQAVLGWCPCPGGLRGWWQEQGQGRVASSIPLFLPFPSLWRGGSGVVPVLWC